LRRRPPTPGGVTRSVRAAAGSLDEEARGFAQRLSLLSNVGRQHRAAVEMRAYDVGQVSPALWAQVRAAAEQVGRELAQLKASSTRQTPGDLSAPFFSISA
jgi:hypothetical protein